MIPEWEVDPYRVVRIPWRKRRILTWDTGREVARVYGDDAARLIAAAPNLLVLAKAVAAHFSEGDMPLGKQARDIIAYVNGYAR